MTANDKAPVANLRTARKEQARARQRHPAGTALPKPAAKAPAKAAKETTPKMRWVLEQERQPGKSAVPQTGTIAGHQYAISAVDGGWSCVHKAPGGKETTLLEKGSYAAAYKAAVEAAKAVA